MYERLPIGLALAPDKKSDALTDQVLRILAACGIRQDDLYKAANDTTNASVKVGLLLTGDKGSCSLHTSSLIIGHATGILERKVGGKSVDAFNDMKALRKELFDPAAWLNNKKSKGRWRKYQELMASRGRTARKLVMPNSTRVAGLILFLDSVLTERWNLDEFFHEVPMQS